MNAVLSMFRRALLVAMAAPLVCSAQEWPTKPVTLVVGFTPGGGADLVARTLGAAMSRILGQPVVVENRPGAGSSTAAAAVARSAPDGHTVLIASPSAIQVNPLIMPKVGYSSERDFAAITQLVESPLIIAVNPQVGVRTLGELVARARKEPGKLSFSSSGLGSASHLAGQLFQEVAGVSLLHVPYRGGAPSVQAVVAGETDIAFASPPSVLGFVKAGRLIGLAVTGSERLPIVADVPSIKEAGMPAYRLPMWYGMFVPAQTPAHVKSRLFTAAKDALASPEVIGVLAREGNKVVTSASPQSFTAFLAEDAVFWAQTVKRTGVKVE